jgi:hypothetical protein
MSIEQAVRVFDRVELARQATGTLLGIHLARVLWLGDHRRKLTGPAGNR